MTVRKTCPSLLIKKCGIKRHSKIVLVLGLATLLVGMYVTLGTARGADSLNFKDTLSTSVPSAEANHTLSFTIQTTIDLGDTLIVTFDSKFANATNGTVDYTDIDLTDDGVDMTLAADCAGTDKYSAVITGDIILTFTACAGDGGNMASGSVVTIEIGTNATSGVAGNAQFENGTAGTADIDLSGDSGVEGSAKVFFISGVTVSATVADTLSVTVALVVSADCDTAMSDFSSATADFVTTTDITVPFGSVTTENFTNGCQSLTIGTNASDGYTATIQETDQLTHTDTTTQINDGACDGSCTDSAAAAWGTETINGFGYCMYDVTGNAALTTDASDDSGTGAVDWVDTNQCDDSGATPFFKTIPDVGDTDTAEAIMRSFAVVSGDNSYVGFRLSVDASQKGTGPSENYSNTIVYIVTPQYD